MTVDFGTEVKDQIPALHDTLEGYHAHLADVAAFYAAQAEVEREFASQQRSLLRKVNRSLIGGPSLARAQGQRLMLPSCNNTNRHMRSGASGSRL